MRSPVRWLVSLGWGCVAPEVRCIHLFRVPVGRGFRLCQSLTFPASGSFAGRLLIHSFQFQGKLCVRYL